jgi:hypothetical protein
MRKHKAIQNQCVIIGNLLHIRPPCMSLERQVKYVNENKRNTIKLVIHHTLLIDILMVHFI